MNVTVLVPLVGSFFLARQLPMWRRDTKRGKAADAAELERLRELYNELIFAVATKHPGETRHETALRYITRAETSESKITSVAR